MASCKVYAGFVAAGVLAGAVSFVILAAMIGAFEDVPLCDRPQLSGTRAGHGSVLVYNFSPSEGEELEDLEGHLERKFWYTSTNRTDNGWQLTARCDWP